MTFQTSKPCSTDELLEGIQDEYCHTFEAVCFGRPASTHWTSSTKNKKKKPSLTSGKEICDFFKSFKYVNILNKSTDSTEAWGEHH